MATTYEKMEGRVFDVPKTNGSAAPAEVKGGKVWGTLRIAIGSIFLWSFLDKAFSLGFSTGRNAETGAIALFGPDAWINGGSPTDGFLQFGLHTKGGGREGVH